MRSKYTLLIPMFLGLVIMLVAGVLIVVESLACSKSTNFYDNVTREIMDSCTDRLYTSTIKQSSETFKNNTYNKGDSTATFVEDTSNISTYSENFIWIKGSDICYPVMQGSDNSFYLKHLPDGSYSSSGSIFIDYRNKPDDTNIIIYGHNMKNGTMFGQLYNYINLSDYTSEHDELVFDWNGDSYLYNLISVRKVKYTDSVYDFNPVNIYDWYYNQLTNNLVMITPDYEVTEYSRFVTLSTCGKTSDEKLVTVWLRKE